MQCLLIFRISKRFTQPYTPPYIKLKILLHRLEEQNMPMSTNASTNRWILSSATVKQWLYARNMRTEGQPSSLQ